MQGLGWTVRGVSLSISLCMWNVMASFELFGRFYRTPSMLLWWRTHAVAPPCILLSSGSPQRTCWVRFSISVPHICQYILGVGHGESGRRATRAWLPWSCFTRFMNADASTAPGRWPHWSWGIVLRHHSQGGSRIRGWQRRLGTLVLYCACLTCDTYTARLSLGVHMTQVPTAPSQALGKICQWWPPPAHCLCVSALFLGERQQKEFAKCYWEFDLPPWVCHNSTQQ